MIFLKNLIFAPFFDVKQSMDHIRNFSVIAHIAHKKSILTDRLLQATHTVADCDFGRRICEKPVIKSSR